MSNLHDLYVEELKDLLNAENQIIKALPKMAKAASNPQLQSAFQEHLTQTRDQVQRLEQIFQKMGVPARSKRCRGMEGIIEEGKEYIEEDLEPEVKDAALISSAQRVEHYEMAGYGTVRTFAKLLGDEDASKLLQQTLDEEGQTDKKLTKLAEGKVNKQAKEKFA